MASEMRRSKVPLRGSGQRVIVGSEHSGQTLSIPSMHEIHHLETVNLSISSNVFLLWEHDEQQNDQSLDLDHETQP